MEKPENLRVTLWGTRGSCPTFPQPWEIREYARRVAVETVRAALGSLAKNLEAGNSLDEVRALLARSPEDLASKLAVAELPVFGGETTCIEVETSEGNTFILDGGSGIRHCAAKVLSERDDSDGDEIYFFGSHEHLDHRLGIPFASLCFADPPLRLRVFGNASFLKALDESFGFFSRTVSKLTYRDNPIDFTMMTATVDAVEICSCEAGKASVAAGPWEVRDIAEPLRIASTVITAFNTNHGSTECLGYKFEHGDRSFVFCTDHEIMRPVGENLSDSQKKALQESLRAEETVAEMCRDADLVYFDGQYYREEYYGRRPIGSTPAVSRVGWGHSCIEDILQVVKDTGIKRALIGHHDPERSWPDQVTMDRDLRTLSVGNDFQVELARDGQSVDL